MRGTVANPRPDTQAVGGDLAADPRWRNPHRRLLALQFAERRILPTDATVDRWNRIATVGAARSSPAAAISLGAELE
jgi:hypothetical protein